MTSDIVGLVADNIMKLLPWRVIGEDQQGVRWTCGRAGVPKAHGWMWFVPIIQSISVVDTTYGTVDIGYQTFGDITLRGEALYRVYEASDFLIFVSDGDHEGVVSMLARSALAHEYRKNPDGLLEKRVLGRMSERLNLWGIKVFKFSITERLQTENVRLLGHIPAGTED